MSDESELLKATSKLEEVRHKMRMQVYHLGVQPTPAYTALKAQEKEIKEKIAALKSA